MKKPLTKAFSRYGASMGRATTPPQGKVHLEHMPLDSGGYDKGGAYWGLRFPVKRTVDNTPPGALGKALHTYTATTRIYRYYNDDCEGFLDAFDREEAKAQILADHPEITFYR